MYVDTLYIEKPIFENALWILKNGIKKIKFRLFGIGPKKLCWENYPHRYNIFYKFHFMDMITAASQ